MKKRLLLLAGCLFALSVQAQTVTKKVDVSSFKGINASGVYVITLEKSNTCSVEVTFDKQYEDAIRIKTSGGILEMYLDRDVMKSKNLRNNVPPVNAIVRMPELNRLSLSGASQLTTSVPFRSNDGFEAQLSGASSLTGLDLTVKGSVNLIATGASSVSMTVTGGDGTFGLSGASNLMLTFTGKNLRVGCCGASTARLDAACADTGLEVSGAAKVNAAGGTDRLHAQCSGASGIDAFELRAQTVDAGASGASLIKVLAEKDLTVNASGTSSIVYAGSPVITVGSIGKTSSLKKRP